MKLIERIQNTLSCFLTKVICSPYIKRVCYMYRYSFSQLWECAGNVVHYGFICLFAIAALLFCPIMQLFYSCWLWRAHKREKLRKTNNDGVERKDVP